ncbi:MAG: maturation protein [Sanya fiers-like virus 33]|nr:MAG: maturation protein [Sanya fiers-like virus 33]
MPWIWQKNYSSNGYRVDNGVKNLFGYTNLVDWKYSETTPGYPNVAPLPAHSWTRRYDKLICGTLNYSLAFPINRVMGVANYLGDWLPNSNLDWTTYSNGLPDESTTVYNQALTAVNSAVKNQKFDISVFVGEFHETMELLAEDASRLLGAARSVKKGRFKDAVRYLAGSRSNKGRQLKVPKGLSKSKSFADNWLKLQFGYKPIVSDMVNAAKAFTDLQKKPKPVVTVYGYGEKSGLSFSSVQSTGLPNPMSWGLDLKWFIKHHWTFKSRIGYVIEADSPVLPTLTSLGLTNPLATAWELAPFSFVVDWFANVGECLSSLDVWNGKRFISGFHTHSRETESEGIIKSWSVGGAYRCNGSGSPLFVRKTFSVTRDALSAPLPPRLQVSLPGSTWHFVTSMSLLRNLFK